MCGSRSGDFYPRTDRLSRSKIIRAWHPSWGAPWHGPAPPLGSFVRLSGRLRRSAGRACAVGRQSCGAGRRADDLRGSDLAHAPRDFRGREHKDLRARSPGGDRLRAAQADGRSGSKERTELAGKARLGGARASRSAPYHRVVGAGLIGRSAAADPERPRATPGCFPELLPRDEDPAGAAS